MKDTKAVVAENLAALRKEHGLTQAQLAEKFNYSDKAVCRWERGDTLPDINTLCSLAEFYGVTMNHLVDRSFDASLSDNKEKNLFKYRLLISVMLVAVIWLFATVFFTTCMALLGYAYWLIFIWAIPMSCLVLSRFWRRVMPAVIKIIVGSIAVWTLITAIFLHLLLVNNVNAWMLFLVGIPLEFIIIFWQQIKYYKNNM